MAFGKFDINMSVEHNNAAAWITLWPYRQTYGSGQLSGFIHIFRQNNQYVKTNREKDTSYGIRYGYDFIVYGYMDSEQEKLLDTGFHLISFEWNLTAMIWKIDENIVYQQNLDRYFPLSFDNNQTYKEKIQPFDHLFYLQITDQFFDIDDNFTNSKFIIDSISYYHLNGSELFTNYNNKSNSTVIYDSNTDNNINYSVLLIILLLIVIIIMPFVFAFYIRKIKINQNNRNSDEYYDDIRETDNQFNENNRYYEITEHIKDTKDATEYEHNYLQIL
jgi:hypothetical protein